VTRDSSESDSEEESGSKSTAKKKTGNADKSVNSNENDFVKLKPIKMSIELKPMSRNSRTNSSEEEPEQQLEKKKKKSKKPKKEKKVKKISSEEDSDGFGNEEEENRKSLERIGKKDKTKVNQELSNNYTQSFPKCLVLYNYEAQNDDELELRRNDIIELIEENTADWWTGRLGKKYGLFPRNHVDKMQSEKTTTTQKKEFKVVAKHKYDAKEDDELSFIKGDIITVISKDTTDWWTGELKNVIGIFPSNFVEPMDAYDFHEEELLRSLKEFSDLKEYEEEHILDKDVLTHQDISNFLEDDSKKSKSSKKKS